ncbi:MAG: hypothetical protein JSS56_07455 [Proteobacteria bacterium]|nr:hypothetical protein [Pseudomonadota bacterium]
MKKLVAIVIAMFAAAACVQASAATTHSTGAHKSTASTSKHKKSSSQTKHSKSAKPAAKAA